MDAYEQAALRAEDTKIEAQSKFNQGNASFREGIGQGQQDPRRALSSVEKGVRLYQDALTLDPDHGDARHNVEVARRAMQALIEQMKNQPQQPSKGDDSKQDQQQGEQQEQQQNQSGQDAGQDAAEKLQELIDQQQQANQQSESLAEQQQQQGNSQTSSSRPKTLPINSRS